VIVFDKQKILMVQLFFSIVLLVFGGLALVDTYFSGWYGFIGGVVCLGIGWWLMRTSRIPESGRDGD
jgi:hypothetical protein